MILRHSGNRLGILVTQAPVSVNRAPRTVSTVRRLVMTGLAADTDRRVMMQSLYDDLAVPDGFRAQIIGTDMIISGPPAGRHTHIVASVRNAIHPARPAGYDTYEATTAQTDTGERYTPDLAMWPVRLLRGSEEWILPAAQCRFALEVTSPGAEYRDYLKASGYAASNVPVYLLADVRKHECIIFTDPEDGNYRTKQRIPFGAPVYLPFDTQVVVDTAVF
jgi:Uma2 family endonuclease